MRNFFILSLPRSRTAWLANFLTFENSFCFHEGLLECDKVDKLKSLFASTGKQIVGNSDCGNILFLDELIKAFPDAKYVVIKRPLEEVKKEMRGMGLGDWDGWTLDISEKRMNEVMKDVDALIIDYHDLDEQACKQIWDHCIGTPFNSTRWRMLDGLDIQIILQKKLEYMRSKLGNIQSLMNLH